jgi:cell division protein FtsI/penicillin-binding protein 2
MEPQTGKVLSIVNQDWAIRRSFKPCSTIKLVTGVAGLNENLIKEDGNIRSRRFPMNLDDALAFSNNRYFQRVGANLGSSKMISYAQALGLGQATGINSENETSGKLPYKNKNVRIYSHGDDFEVSPLQLAVMVSAISNGGKIVVPKIPRTTFDKTNFRGAMRRQVKLPDQNLKGVVPGMIGAASYGTARRGVDHSLGIAGKTGSCIADGSWVGLFASVAPIENPQVAVVVITRGEDERGKYAAAVAGKIYQSMRFRLLENGSKNLAKVPEDLKPEPKINAKTSALLDKAEGEESEDNEAASIVKNETRKETIVGQTAPTAPKTIARSSGKSSNLFPSIVINVKRPRDEIVKKSRDEMSRQRIVTNK